MEREQEQCEDHQCGDPGSRQQAAGSRQQAASRQEGVIKSEGNLIRAEIRQEHNLAAIKERSTTLHQHVRYSPQSTVQRAMTVKGPSVSAASHPR
jgi:hypothetical protein